MPPPPAYAQSLVRLWHEAEPDPVHEAEKSCSEPICTRSCQCLSQNGQWLLTRFLHQSKESRNEQSS